MATRKSKYAPLASYLAGRVEHEVRLSFAEVETILGAPLPPTAFNNNTWWSNSRTDDSHTWAHLWLRAGWTKVAVSRSERWVTFRRMEHYAIADPRAVEGYEFDAKVVLRARNQKLADQCRIRDNFTCRACGFHLAFEGSHVIEVHHVEPLGQTGERETRLDELVCLCPTCHRIAHLRSFPYPVADIQRIRSENGAA